MMSLMSDTDKSASDNACFSGTNDSLTISSTNDSNLARVILIAKCLGPDASAVMYGKFTSVCCADDNSIFAFSPASFKRCIASGSLRKSTP